jgi:aldose 1-epimerase
MNPQPFGKLPDGHPAQLFTLQLPNGVRADLTDYGATLVRLRVPDRAGRLDDVALGFDSVEKYAAHSAYIGGIVGRFGNRIAAGRFTLDGKTHSLVTNNSPGGRPCHLHGGLRGFDKVLWEAEAASVDGAPALRLSYHSPNGEEGYPGNVTLTVTYSLPENGSLRIDYEAVSDRPTPLNPTNHAYFNLRDEGAGDILTHELTIHASRYTPVDAGMIPTGRIEPVHGTPLDFTTAHRIGERVDARHEQLLHGSGYDHNFVADVPPSSKPALIASVHEPQSGRLMEVLTTEPGVQFYSGNHLDGSLIGKTGRTYPRRSGFCLETQHFPDSPNQPDFPDTILRPGRTFRSTTIYRFSAR